MSAQDEMRNIGDPKELDRLIAAFIAAGMPWRAELYRAVRRSEIAVIEPRRNAVISDALLAKQTRSCLILLGDDDYESTGPTGWASLRRIAYWARSGMIHATGGDVASYRMAAAMAVLAERAVLVETSSPHAKAWTDALRKRGVRSCLTLVPPTGPHPAMPDRRAAH